MIMPNVLMTGGTGFVGKWMQKTRRPHVNIWAMSREDYETYSLDRISGIHFVIHLAPIDPALAIECAHNNNARLLYCSSGIVYHAENDTQYRRDKMRWEADCLASGLDVVIARLFSFWGSCKMQKAFFNAARNGEPLEIWGDVTRSLMTGADMGRRMWDILRYGEMGQAYDVGSTRPITALQLAQRIKALCNTTSEIVDVSEIVKEHIENPIPMPHYVPENVVELP